MFQVVYISRSTRDFDEQSLRELANAAAVNNSSSGITGALLFVSGRFIQVLEGSEDVVRSLLNDISKDKRHRNMKIILEENEKERDFPKWSMGFVKTGFPGDEEISLIIENSNPLRSRDEALTCAHSTLAFIRKIYHSNENMI